MASELNWEVLLAVAGYLAMSTVLIVGVYLSRKEIRRIRGKAEPLMDKASSALDRMEAMEERLADLQMVPATIVVGIENAMKAQLETREARSVSTRGRSLMKVLRRSPKPSPSNSKPSPSFCPRPRRFFRRRASKERRTSAKAAPWSKSY